MKAHNFITRGYGVLLKCYPRHFQQDYGDEMRGVFAQTVQEAARRGWLALAAACWREARDWPGAVVLEHWRAFSQREVTMPTNLRFHIFEAHDDGQPGTGREAFWAGLPFLVVSALFGLMPLLGRLDEVVNFSALVGLAVAVVGVMVFAWLRGWPRWSASWILFGMLVFVYVLGLFASTINENTQQVALLLALVILCAAILPSMLYFIARQDRLRGLLLILPFLLIMWLPVLEFVPNEIRNPLQALAWLLAALVAGGLVKLGNVRVGVLAVIALNLFTGAAYAFARTFYNTYPASASLTEALEMEYVYNFLPVMAALSTLVIGPVVLRALNQLGHISDGVGRLGNILTVAGLALAVLGNLCGFMFSSFSELSAILSTPLISQAFLWAAYLGQMVFVIGVIMVVISAAQRKALPQAALAGLLVLVPLGLPFVAMLPLWLNLRVLPTDVPFSFLQPYEYKLAAYVLAGVWLVAGCGLAFYLTRRPVQAISQR